MRKSPSNGRSEPKHDGVSPGKTSRGVEPAHSALVSSAAEAVPEERHQRISLAAYRRAEARGFVPGSALEDWLAAEREVDAEINT